MNFFNKRTKPQEDKEERANKISSFALSGSVRNYSTEKALNLSAVYRAVNLISDSVSELPLEIFYIDSNGGKVKATDLPLYHILNCEPNKRMTRATFFRLLVTSCILDGVGYAYIERKGDSIVSLHYIPKSYVTINPPSRLDLPPTFQIQGITGTVEEKDLIRILNFTYDGIYGYGTLDFASRSLGLAESAEESAKNFYDSGACLHGLLTIDGASTPRARENLKNAWTAAFGGNNGGGSSVAVLESNMRYEPISVNPVDSQLLESREFSVVEISRWFGISPTLLNDLSKSSYSTLEASNLQFLTQTLNPILSKIENEVKRKLLNNHNNMDVRFNTATLLRTDRSSLASYYSQLFNIGAMNINEIRSELDLPSVEGGEHNFIQVNVQALNRALSEQPADSQDIKEALNNNNTVEENN